MPSVKHDVASLAGELSVHEAIAAMALGRSAQIVLADETRKMREAGEPEETIEAFREELTASLNDWIAENLGNAVAATVEAIADLEHAELKRDVERMLG